MASPSSPKKAVASLSRPGKPGGRREQNRKEKTQRLQDAGLELFLEKGIEATTIDDVTGRAQVAKGSFYRYFADKEALVEALFSPISRAVFAAMEACGATLADATDDDAMREAYAELGAAFAGVFLEHSHALLLYLQENRGPATGARRPIRALADEVSKQAIHLTHVARDAGLLRPFPAEVSALAVVGAIERLLFSVLSGSAGFDPLSLATDLSSLILDGLRPQGDAA